MRNSPVTLIFNSCLCGVVQAVFIDIEVNPSDNKILDLGAVTSDGHQLHCVSQGEFCDFVSGIEFVGGHNILAHDLTYIGELLGKNAKYIDTLYLSPLMFPTKPYHALLKDDKISRVLYIYQYKMSNLNL